MQRRRSLSHWGAFSATVADGRLVSMAPFEHDPRPSPLNDAWPEMLTSPLRVERPAIRRGWLDGDGGRARGEDEIAAPAFLKLAKEKAASLKIDFEMLKRGLNVGFSGGEKKRMEILQMAMLSPKFLILDETDSGLDIDALKIVSEGVNALRSPERGMLVITHYQRLLNHIKPDKVHVLAAGRIVASGGPELALQLEAEGYDRIVGAAA